jgi:regulator of replication initiation timing
MNNLRKAYIKGLVKEAASLSDIKDKLMAFYGNHKDIINRVGIDAAGGLGLMGLGKVTDMLTGTKTTGRSHLLRLLLGTGLAEAGQYGYKKYKGLKQDLADAQTNLDIEQGARATDAVHAAEGLRTVKENHAKELAKRESEHTAKVNDLQNNLNARIEANDKLVAANAQLREQLANQPSIDPTSAGRMLMSQDTAYQEQLARKNDQINKLYAHINAKNAQIADEKASTKQATIDTRNRASERVAEDKILEEKKKVTAEQGQADSKRAYRETLAKEVKNAPSNLVRRVGEALINLSK